MRVKGITDNYRRIKINR